MVAIERASELDRAEPDLTWLRPPVAWGERIEPRRYGLRIGDVDRGQAPEVAAGRGKMPRGTVPLPTARRVGRAVQTKADIWADNCALLYEEAISRQWASATDIPWEMLTPLSDEMERAMCQLCTHFVEVEFSAGDAPSQWVRRMSPEHFEAKLFLTSQVGDEARHLEVFRKRALANGGGLMRQSAGNGQPGATRLLLEFQDFTEMSVITHVVGEGQVLTMFRMGELVSSNEAEKRIFKLVAQDEARHVAFGVMHLKYILTTQPERREEIHAQLDVLETSLADPATTILVRGGGGERMEPLLVLLGGGLNKIDEGYKKYLMINKKMVNEYLHRLEVAGMPERRQRLSPALAVFAD
jgi:hypothetical protein